MNARTPSLYLITLAHIGILMLTWAASAATLAHEEFEQHDAHEHGRVTLNVALEGQTLLIELEAPADNVIGFEHAPRSEAEHVAVRDVATWLQSGNGLFAFPPAAACEFVATELNAPQWGEGNHHHADYEARFSYRCEQPQRLDWLQLRLLTRLHHLHEARVNVLTASRQASETVTSADARVRLR